MSGIKQSQKYLAMGQLDKAFIQSRNALVSSGNNGTFYGLFLIYLDFSNAKTEFDSCFLYYRFQFVETGIQNLKIDFLKKFCIGTK